MATKPSLAVTSLRGGLNTTDPAHAIPEDQCTSAMNVEWRVSTIGERRRGMTKITLGAGLETQDEVSWLGRHLPTTDEGDAQLWAVGHTSPSTIVVAYKDTSWHAVVPDDPLEYSNSGLYELSAVSLHGKFFLAYKANGGIQRLHVWDGTKLRKAGIDMPAAAPTAANTGAGAFAGTRYYRVRWAVTSGATVLRRSEPSDTLTFNPSGAGSGVIVTRPTTAGAESPTDWELEASVDNALFYRVTRLPVGTTTYTDSTPLTTGYSAGPLSEDIEAYSLIPSGKFLLADEDRLLIAGNWEDSALASRVTWTPVYGSTGSGNDERIDLNNDPFLDLDGFEGGPITGMKGPINGYIYVFKQSHIYRLARTGQVKQSYMAIPLTKQVGAIPGSIVDGVDQSGRPCIYFLDRTTGSWRLGASGLEYCGEDIRFDWQSFAHVDASTIAARSLYYPNARQIQFYVASNGAATPNLGLILHTKEIQSTPNGARRGWSEWDGSRVQVRAACLFAENIEDNTTRSRTLIPLVAVPLKAGFTVHITDTGDVDTLNTYNATITTKPYSVATILNQWSILAASVLAKAAAGVELLVKATRDFGLEIKKLPIDLTPTLTEDSVVRKLDNLSFSELTTIQFTFSDLDIPTGYWALNQLVTKPTPGQTS